WPCAAPPRNPTPRDCRLAAAPSRARAQSCAQSRWLAPRSRQAASHPDPQCRENRAQRTLRRPPSRPRRCLPPPPAARDEISCLCPRARSARWRASAAAWPSRRPCCLTRLRGGRSNLCVRAVLPTNYSNFVAATRVASCTTPSYGRARLTSALVLTFTLRLDVAPQVDRSKAVLADAANELGDERELRLDQCNAILAFHN